MAVHGRHDQDWVARTVRFASSFRRRLPVKGGAPTGAPAGAPAGASATAPAGASAGALTGLVAACLGVLALTLSGCLLLPEEEFSGARQANRIPIARITGGVLADSTDQEARVHFYWSGADYDGVVRWFEWAIDDTISERAWQRTTDYDEIISFPASTPGLQGREFHDWHTFYVRAVDDDFARSKPDQRFFNAHTIAPVTEIEKPQPADNVRWASTLLMSWRAEDLDGSRPDRLPAAYEIKLVRMPTSIALDDQAAILGVFADSANQLVATPLRGDYPLDNDELYQKARRRWLRLPGETNEHWLEGMEPYERYGFIVRSIDEAGAVEENFQRNRNYVIFRVADKQITIRLFEPAFGSREYNTGAWPEPWVVTVAPYQQIRFQWIGDASLSGTEAGPSNYGFDIPDPDDDSFRSLTGRGGWIGWATRTRMQAPVYFTEEDEDAHYFYLKMRDVSNNPNTETRCVVQVRVAEFSFDRPLLVVDDLRYGPKPCQGGALVTDAETDPWRLRYDEASGRYRGVLSGAQTFLPAVERIALYNTYGVGDQSVSPTIENDFVEILGQYQTVIWDTGNDSSVGTGLRLAAGVNQYLSSYVSLGGNLLLYTFIGPVQLINGFVSFSGNAPNCPGEMNFQAGYYWNRIGFLWQFLRLQGCVDKPRGMTSQGSVGKSLRAAVAANPRYPDLYLDSARWPCEEGVMNYEALVSEVNDPDVAPWYEFQEGLEVVYRAQTLEAGSRLDGHPVAWRTSPVAGENADRGRVVCFSFHPYYFEEEAVEIAMTQAIHWLVTGADY